MRLLPEYLRSLADAIDDCEQPTLVSERLCCHDQTLINVIDLMVSELPSKETAAEALRDLGILDG